MEHVVAVSAPRRAGIGLESQKRTTLHTSDSPCGAIGRQQSDGCWLVLRVTQLTASLQIGSHLATTETAANSAKSAITSTPDCNSYSPPE